MSCRFFIRILFLFIHSGVQSQNDTVRIETDILQQQGKLEPIWAYFGYDEPNYTYMKDGKKLLSEIARFNQVPVYVRAHNMLTSGDGSAALKWGSTNAYTEDDKGNAVYNWAIVDSIFDTYIQNGMRPIAEIGFMPEALSIKPQPYRHYWKPGHPYDEIYTGWAYPPKDYKKWGTLVHEWVKHSIQRYGEAEVKTWWWEVWNEPNISYWKGTEEEYFMLYDYAADAVKRALPAARIGGPTSTGPGWDKANLFLKHFLDHCANGKNYTTGKKGAPLDYISFHAKGSPKVINGYVRMNMTSELKDISKGFETVAASAFKHLPIIIGECDPEGCAACGMTTNPENAYRNGTMYSSYTASSFARIFDIAKRHGVYMKGAVSWSFEFENQRWFDGFRDLATNGVDKPVLNIFRMFALMQENKIAVKNKTAIPLDSLIYSGVHGSIADIDALASAGKGGASVMVWNYHDDDLPAPDATVQLTIKHIPGKKVLVHHYRVDKDNSNSYELWKKMGSPQDVTPEQYTQLEKAGQLALLSSPEWKIVKNGELQLSFALPRQAVSLVRITFY
jgi:xylan 1,4-beta-xylosidase